MAMAPRLRKVALTAHVSSSVGWLGAVAGFLALAVVGLTSRDDQTVRSVYLMLDLTAWYVIVPLCLASVLTALVSSLSTPWGLFRHYWVLLKILITIPSSLMLLVHMQPIGYMAGIAANTPSYIADLQTLKIQLVVEAGAALLVLLVATALSVYKPKGMTPFGWRKQQEQRALAQP
jgi:hypothetical protein